MNHEPNIQRYGMKPGDALKKARPGDIICAQCNNHTMNLIEFYYSTWRNLPPALYNQVAAWRVKELHS